MIPWRKILATAEQTTSPPDGLTETQSIARVIKAEGNNLYSVVIPSEKALMVEMPAKFRSTFWLKRGGYVVVDVKTHLDRGNKIQGEIINVVRDEKVWRKEPYWPEEFQKKLASQPSDSDEEQSNVGMMPPSDDEDNGV